MWLIIFSLESNGQDEELKLGGVNDSDLKSTDVSKKGGGDGVGERGEGVGEVEGEGMEGKGGGGVRERVGEEEKGTVTGVVAGVGVVVEGVREGEWDEDKWSVSESEYKKYVKDSDIEDYLRGKKCHCSHIIIVIIFISLSYQSGYQM